MRRDYGSNLFNLVDAPSNLSTISKIYKETATALAKWEPRLKVTSVSIASAAPGAVVLDIYGTYLPDGQAITIDGIQVS